MKITNIQAEIIAGQHGEPETLTKRQAERQDRIAWHYGRKAEWTRKADANIKEGLLEAGKAARGYARAHQNEIDILEAKAKRGE